MTTISWTDAQQSIVYFKKDVTHASGWAMLTCIRMQNLIKIYHVVQELPQYSHFHYMIANGQTDSPIAVLAIYGQVMISPTYKQTKVSVQQKQKNFWLFHISIQYCCYVALQMRHIFSFLNI